MHKSKINSSTQQLKAEETISGTDSVKPEDLPIIEIKEKLVESKSIRIDPHAYFVIIGSFRSLNNAKNYQELIGQEGFTSVLLQNEAGLYRVAVKSTDDISIARIEIQRIRTNFKNYADTWLLISVK